MKAEGSRDSMPVASEAACRAVCRAAVRLGETLELRKRADVALDSFIQLTGASAAEMFLALEGERYVRVAGTGTGLRKSLGAIEHPGLPEGLLRVPEPQAVSDLPRRNGALGALRKDLQELGAQWVIALLPPGRPPLGLVALAGEGPATSYSIRGSWILSELAALVASALVNAHSYEMAIFDEPTGLLSARYYHLRLREELRRAIRHHKGLALLLVRLDGLRSSEPEGVNALRESAETVRDLIRADLDIPARYGENELAIILPDTVLEGAKVLAGRMRERLSAGGMAVGSLEVSIGIAGYPEHADTVEELAECAERALEQAGKEGGIAALPPTPREAVDYAAMRKSPDAGRPVGS